MQSVQRSAFGVDEGLRRIQVLRLLVRFHRSTAERDDRACVARNRDHEPAAKAIDGLSVVALDSQAAAYEQWQRKSFVDERGLEAFVGRRRVSHPQLLDRLSGDAARLQELLRFSSDGCRQLRLEVLGRALMDLQQRLALGGIGVRLAAADLFRNRDAELRRKMPHRILEPHSFLELEKLEHVAAHAAAEAVKKSLIAVDVKRRRFL